MVQPHIGNHTYIGVHHPVLRYRLKRGVHRHTLDDQHFSVLFDRPMQDLNLLLDVGPSVTDQGALNVVYSNDHRVRAGCLTEHPPASCPQSRINQPGHRGFPSDSIDINYMFQLFPITSHLSIFPNQHPQAHRSQSYDQPGHILPPFLRCPI